MKISNKKELDFDDVLILPKKSLLHSRSQVDILREFHFYHSTKTLQCTPLVAANMDTTGSFYMADSFGFHNAITCLNKHYSIDQYVNFYENYKYSKDYPFISIGTSDADIEKLIKITETLQKHNPSSHNWSPNICVDVANGYSTKFVDVLKKIRQNKLFQKTIIMAGNVVTPNMVEELILYAGVDIIKVGIGSGSVCTTRLKTGIGRPQLSAVMECAEAAHTLGGYVCSDGGCKTPADVCKAFCGGADFVMLGGMIAGTNECDGEWEYEYRCVDLGGEFWQPIDPGYDTAKRKKNLKFYGMSSKEAQDKHNDGLKDYRASEGKSVNIEYKGLVHDVLRDILGGIRSCCTYVGAFNIKTLPQNTEFIRVNNTHNKVYE